MFKFHIPYKGPPEKCEAHDYWYLFLFACAAAGLEFALGNLFAHSSAVMADAIHAFMHGVLYAITALSGWFFAKKKYPPGKRQKISVILGAVVYTPIILLGLGYVLVFEAWPKFFHPAEVFSGFMALSAAVGIAANFLALLGLKEIKKRHGTKDARHSLLSLDALGDIIISFTVLVGALSIKLTGIYQIDALIAFGAAGWILWQVYRILRNEIKALI